LNYGASRLLIVNRTFENAVTLRKFSMSQDSSPLSKSGKASPTKVDPEVKAKPERRQLSAEYKRRILEEADACAEAGQIGALLHREGLYSSNLTHWRQQRAEGALKALSPKKRGPKPDPLADDYMQTAYFESLL
jgi:transposase-like protein